MSATFKLRKNAVLVMRPRSIAARDSGFTVPNMCLPIPDLNSITNKIEAVIKRLDSPDVMDRKTMRRFRSFVRRFIRKYIPVFAQNTVFDFYVWLAQTAYPEWRKKELIEAFNRMLQYGGAANELSILKHIKSFTKWEEYEQFKYARTINARCDAAKVTFGPYIHALETVMYSLTYGFSHSPFVKHIPVADRPRYIQDFLQLFGNSFYATDYKNYEGRQKRLLVLSCEMELYKHAFRNFPEIVRKLQGTIAAEKQKLHFGDLVSVIDCARMSGEMSTSLGNGFLNMMAILFLCSERHIPVSGLVVEGDDGLVSSPDFPVKEDFLKLNLDITIEKHDKISTAKFCQLVYTEDYDVIVDPLKVLVRLGWIKSPRMHGDAHTIQALLKAKAYSYLYLAPNCPIVRELCLKVLELTSKVKPIFEYDYYHNLTITQKQKELAYEGKLDVKLNEQLSHPIPQAARELAYEVFDVNPVFGETVEKYIRSKTALDSLSEPWLCNECYRKYPDGYTYAQYYSLSVPAGVTNPSIVEASRTELAMESPF